MARTFFLMVLCCLWYSSGHFANGFASVFEHNPELFLDGFASFYAVSGIALGSLQMVLLPFLSIALNCSLMVLLHFSCHGLNYFPMVLCCLWHSSGLFANGLHMRALSS